MAIKNVSLAERVVHALGYEFFAVLFCAPVLSLIFDKPLSSTGALAVVMSLIAMAWNMAYNWLVDRWIALPRLQWSGFQRFLHGMGFEAGIIVWCLPVAAWMLKISLFEAFLLEIGFFVFILPYTIAYNWAFDKLKARYFGGARLAQEG